MPDTEQGCKDCNIPFVITEGEQKWYGDKQMFLPVRCKNCRRKKKVERYNQEKNEG